MRRKLRTVRIITSLAILLVSFMLVVPSFAGNSVTIFGEIPSAPAPTAQFTATPLSGSAPLTVQFTDQSTGSITSWAWDFDNNGVIDSNMQNPGYTYATAGTYTVKLTVIGPGGSDDEVKTGYIKVTSPKKPVADFIATPTSGSTPLAVQFTDQSSNNPTSWKWEYRKGTGSWTQFSIAQSPSYTFTAIGTYSIRLTATNAAGSHSQTRMHYITVTPLRKPIALFSQDKVTGRVPLTVSFTDRSLFNPTEYLWNFGDGGTSTEKNPVHTYTRTGIFTVQLKASNVAGSDTARRIVIVLNTPWWR
ncbi:MAG TPA: PKD domain-containing protein [Methanolinea sp.]|nr:PKD domain-containing protein [Methanolinea sp.]